MRPSKEERRAQILDCARVVFAEKGYHQATVDDIVALVGVARGTFYLYFEDKRAALAALVDDFFERMVASIQGIDVSEGAPAPTQQLEDNLVRVARLALDDPAMMKIILHDTAGIDPAFDEKLHAFYGSLRMYLEETLAEGQQLGLVRDGDRPVMVSLGLGALKEILLATVTGITPRTPEELAKEIMRFLEGGLLALAARRER
ncbi:MAG: TetR/AcrR family transcriptional regulator [Myxococcota bacterium]